MPDRPPTEMSGRTMLLLGGIGALLVAVVLGASLLMRGAPASSAAPAPLAVSPVSAGSVAMPQLAGMSLHDASAALTREGLRLASVVRLPSARSTGIVIRTYPAAGTIVATGGLVTLYVSY